MNAPMNEPSTSDPSESGRHLAGCPELAVLSRRLLAILSDPEGSDRCVAGHRNLDLQRVWHAMGKDHAENRDGQGSADWPSTLIAALEALARIAEGPTGEPAAVGNRFRHVMRGSIYRVIGTGLLQSGTSVPEGTPIVVYVCESDGRLWLRPEAEFTDGRFVLA